MLTFQHWQLHYAQKPIWIYSDFYTVGTKNLEHIFLIQITPRISIQKAAERKTAAEKYKNTVRANRNLGSYYLVCIRGC